MGTSTTPEAVWTCSGSPALVGSQASSPSSPLKLVRTAWVFSLKWAPICDLFGVSVTEIGSEETLLVDRDLLDVAEERDRGPCALSICGSF